MREPLLDNLADLSLVLFAAAAGLLIGSFLNVCIYRIPRDLSVVVPRSFCPECEAPVAAFDNLPVFSFLFLRGRCRSCRARISFRYPAVEVMTGVLFGWVVFRYGATAAALKWLVFEALLVLLFWTDWEVQILPDEITLGGSAAAIGLALFVPVPGALGTLVFNGSQTVLRSLLNLAAGALLLAVPLWILGAVYGKLRKREALGFGDVKLLLLMGSFLGLRYGLIALVAGAVAGAIIGAAWAVIAGKKLATFELPFGSFLCAAAALVPLLNEIGRV